MLLCNFWKSGVSGKTDICIRLSIRQKVAIRLPSLKAPYATYPRILQQRGSVNQFVLLDEDRIQQDKKAGRDAHAVASKHKIEIILQLPNLEGLLLPIASGKGTASLAGKHYEGEIAKTVAGV